MQPNRHIRHVAVSSALCAALINALQSCRSLWSASQGFSPAYCQAYLISAISLQEAEEKQRNVIGKRMTAPKAFPRVALDLATTVERIQQNFVICDPNLPDCPIVFASDGFIELTEYPRHEVLGRNCRSVTCKLCADSKKFGRHGHVLTCHIRCNSHAHIICSH